MGIDVHKIVLIKAKHSGQERIFRRETALKRARVVGVNAIVEPPFPGQAYGMFVHTRYATRFEVAGRAHFDVYVALPHHVQQLGILKEAYAVPQAIWIAVF
jgi:hypothetical protein